MITDEQARAVVASMRNAWSWHTPAEVGTLLAWARQELSRREQPDDGPITAEWCRENGAKLGHDVVRDDVRLWSAYWHLASVVVAVNGGVRFVINGYPVTRQLTRSELLAIVSALRGKPSGQTGQLPEPLSTAEQLPHVSRGQLNNLGGGR